MVESVAIALKRLLARHFTSVLDLNCRSHDIENLYVVDGSFFPSNSGVNPTLTIIANALRVGDHIAEMFKS